MVSLCIFIYLWMLRTSFDILFSTSFHLPYENVEKKVSAVVALESKREKKLKKWFWRWKARRREKKHTRTQWIAIQKHKSH